jgi:NYN domain
MANAIDNSPPFTIILITGDRAFAYLVSILRLRQYHVIVIVPPNHHSSLTYQASAVLYWDTQMIQQQNQSTIASPSDSAPLATPPQPFSFPNTFPVSSSKQAMGTITSVPPVTLSDTLQSPTEHTISINLLPHYLG